MYLEHFGLNEPPFRITPHTDFFFDGANRGATLDALIYAITHDEGIVKVSGEVGSGKTMLCRVLMERLPKNVTIIYLANPSLSRDDILYAIADELRLDVQQSSRASVVLRALHDSLITSFSEGRQVVVLIDEAHAMPVETLEEIRLLSNLETNRNKLLQLVLFGQPELNEILAGPEMRQLKERITHNFRLEPLVRDDIAHYLDFRMRAAGYRGPSVFTPTALKVIAQNSLGLTRRINILADKALLAAFSAGSHQIGPKEIRAAVRDCEFSDATAGSQATRNTQTLRVVGLLAIAVLAGMVWLFAASRSNSGAQPPVAGAPAMPPVAVATVPPVPAVPATTVAAEPAPAPSPAPAPPAPPPAPPAPAPSPVAAPSPVTAAPPSPAVSPAPAAPAVSPAPAASPATAPSPTPAATAVAANPSAPSPAQRVEPAGAAAPPPAVSQKVGRLTRARLEAGRAWLDQTPDDRWFIQVFATDAGRHAEIETLLRRMSSSGIEMANVHVYYSELSGKPRYGVIYGSYASSNAAAAAMRGLPQLVRINKPYPRQAVRLR